MIPIPRPFGCSSAASLCIAISGFRTQCTVNWQRLLPKEPTSIAIFAVGIHFAGFPILHPSPETHLPLVNSTHLLTEYVQTPGVGACARPFRDYPRVRTHP